MAGNSVADASTAAATPRVLLGWRAGGRAPPGEFPASDRGRENLIRTGLGRTDWRGGRVVRRRDERRIYLVQSEPRQRCVRQQHFGRRGAAVEASGPSSTWADCAARLGLLPGDSSVTLK